MNDLRLAQQIEPEKKIIVLEFKQITTLEPMMPLLAKFENLQSLSVHGNRLKSLPKDMSMLQSLKELDISNNLFTDLQEVISSLKTIPLLNHLIINFKNQQEEDFIRNSLPELQRINKKPVKIVSKTHSTKSNTKNNHKQYLKLSEEDLESVGLLYDEIREIYKDSKSLVDKELAEDFDQSVENIMSELSHKLVKNDNEVENLCNIYCGKYALIDICFVKLITYFYHFEKSKHIATVLQKIHDYQADMFRSISDLVFEESHRSKIEVNRVKIQKEELLKAEIKRLKNYQIQSNRQIEYLEARNKEYIQKLMKYSKEHVLETSIGKAINTSRSTSKRKSKANKEMTEIITVKTKPKTLTQHQLKEVIAEIYQSKNKQNLICSENNLPFETMETHMYTYLNQKYGLKSLGVEWAMSIVNGIRKYGQDDPEIATFGKILRNQVEQSFVEDLKKIKEQFGEALKKFKKSVGAGLEENEVTVHQSQQILLYLNLKREQISIIMSRITDDKLINNFLTIDTLQKSLLDFYVRKHDEKIFALHKQFKLVDEDEDGIINVEQLQKLIGSFAKNVDLEDLMPDLDPSKKGIITFSHLCEVLQTRPQTKQLFKQPD